MQTAVEGEKVGGTANYVLNFAPWCVWLGRCYVGTRHQVTPYLSPGSQERKGVGINLPASSSCARFLLKQIVLKQDTWEGSVTGYDRKCCPSCLIQICLSGTQLSLRSANLCCQMPPLAVAASTITGGSSSQLRAKPRTVLPGFKYCCLGIPGPWSYYRPHRPALLNSDPVFNHRTAIMAPQAKCLPWKITQPL